MSENPTEPIIAMVIDDNKIDLYITSRVIRKMKDVSLVVECASGQSALQYLSQNKHDMALLPNFIFVDIYMPQMSGFEFMEAFDTLPDSLKDQCKCYIISSTIDEKDINRANADKNVVAFREKPVPFSFLEQVIIG